MKLIIAEHGEGLVGVLDNYDGPVPRDGEFIIHPALGDHGDSEPDPSHIGNVLQVRGKPVYGLMARPSNGEPYFVGRPEPYVLVWT